jgi:hypothetical protein
MAQLSHPESRDALRPESSGSQTRVRASLAAIAADANANADANAKTVRDGGETRARVKLAAIVAQLAVQDWFLAAYFFILTCAVAFSNGEKQAESLQWVAVDVLVFVAGVALTRGGVIPRGTFANNLVYRIALFASFQASYFQLRFILPTVNARVLDADILAFDLKTFGYEPAIVWDRFVTPSSVEWFAFFYFSYFFLLATHVIPMVLLDRKSKRLAHFCLGMFMVYAVGHIGYMLVPGFGPYHHLAGQFEHPIEGGLFWKLVVATVEGAGAQKDIFPSLHTAAPTFFAIFSFMHRRTNPFRYTWPVMTFFASQIILATMFLRWHWLIDVVVGFSVAATAAFVSRRIIGWEWKRRARLGLPQVFEALSWPASRTAENAENIEEKPTA